MSDAPIQHWLIRSPYQHQTWDDVLMRNRFRLQGIRNAEAARSIGRMKPGDIAMSAKYHGQRRRPVDEDKERHLGEAN